MENYYKERARLDKSRKLNALFNQCERRGLYNNIIFMHEYQKNDGLYNIYSLHVSDKEQWFKTPVVNGLLMKSVKCDDVEEKLKMSLTVAKNFKRKSVLKKIILEKEPKKKKVSKPIKIDQNNLF
jgi:hypothetical protein